MEYVVAQVTQKLDVPFLLNKLEKETLTKSEFTELERVFSKQKGLQLLTEFLANHQDITNTWEEFDDSDGKIVVVFPKHLMRDPSTPSALRCDLSSDAYMGMPLSGRDRRILLDHKEDIFKVFARNDGLKFDFRDPKSYRRFYPSVKEHALILKALLNQ